MADLIIDTDVLVVGAGPAGGAAASFLGQNGLSGILISSANGTAETPRAHVVNPFAIECFRDLGLEDEVIRLGVSGEKVEAFRWCRSLVGEEYGKLKSMGAVLGNAYDIARTSPCSYIDFPQSFMEPLLVKYASHHKFEINFNTQLVDAQRDGNGVLCTVRKTNSALTYKIRAKYLLGADGGRSTVARAFPFKFHSEPSGGTALNILFNADLSQYMTQRDSMLHFILKPDRKWRAGVGSSLRMVRPYHQWLFSVISQDTDNIPWKDFTKDTPLLMEHLKECIGVEDVDIEILTLDSWVIREVVAENYISENDVFLLGDAAHRHPPAYGLGSNTCVQDAYNIAWKVAYVHRGLAGKGLLDSYNAERQPVGANLVKEANNGIRQHLNVWEPIGMFAPTAEEGVKQLNELYEASDAGKARRKRLDESIQAVTREGRSIGIGMNQWYDSSAIYVDDESGPRPEVVGDPIIEPLISTYPGVRLPHAWLDVSTRKKEISTHDLAGHGAFCLFTGQGGEGWLRAAEKIAGATGIPLKAYGIGFGQQYHDVYRQWYHAREIEDDGCVLVRPDRFVAWRSMASVADPEAKLTEVLDSILSRAELKQ